MKHKLGTMKVSDPQSVMKDDEVLSNSNSPSFETILQTRISRRSVLQGGLGIAASVLTGISLTGCDDDDDNNSSANNTDTSTTTKLNFSSVAGSDADMLVVPEGYQTSILMPWGTPLTGAMPAYVNDGSGSTNNAAEQAMQVGQNHDGMTFFPLSNNSSDNGLLCVNHEYTNSTLYPGGSRTEDENGAPTDPDQVRKDMNAHGVSVVEIQRAGDNTVSIVPGSVYNRRITLYTPMQMSGPAAGSEFLVTAYDNSGMTTRGTVNNCARGFTPWGTYLTCEENTQGYFITNEENPSRDKARMGINSTGFGYLWSNVAGDASEVNGEFARFDTTPTGADATQDYRNEANNFGWIVEIDPRDPNAMPIKRTAMGRMRHEGCEPGRVIEGRQIAFYMGDDARFDYFYKFVTADAYDSANPNPNMLDNGTLYVARFDADGKGVWLPLVFGEGPLVAPNFTSQADVLVNARSAADALGATPMDRPEWSTTDPNTGEIYLTLTNNTRRESADAANPRAPNSHGHVIRIGETDDNPAATTFAWDIFLFGSNASADPSFNLSGLTLDNELGSPDGIWFDKRGVLWIQTDNGAPLDSNSNDQMLAVIPSELDGDRTLKSANQTRLRRFFVGPAGCEVTGVDMTPDYRTMFVNIQHPRGNWPDGGESVPRSATVVITRTDGGQIGIDA